MAALKLASRSTEEKAGCLISMYWNWKRSFPEGFLYSSYLVRGFDVQILKRVPHRSKISSSPICKPRHRAQDYRGTKYHARIVHVVGTHGEIRRKHHEYNQYDRVDYRSYVDR